MKKKMLLLLAVALLLCLLPGMTLEAKAETVFDYCHGCKKNTDFEILGYTTPPGETQGHWTRRRCLECDRTETVFDPRLAAHTGGSETPTCTTGKTCSKCGSEYGKLGHDWGAWTSNGDSTHTRLCRREGCSAADTGSCSGDGSATCIQQGQCSACGGLYFGDHSYGSTWSYDSEGHWKTCVYCSVAGKDKVGHMIVENPMPEYLKSVANCTSRAIYYKSCPFCHYKDETATFVDPYKEKDPDNHDIVHHEAQAPTCTEAGWKAYDACSRCDYGTTRVELPALGHDMTVQTVAPTCEKAGYTLHACSRCEYSYTDGSVSRRGHWYGEWTGDGSGSHSAACQRKGCGKKGAVECQTMEFSLSGQKTASVCPVCGETGEGDRLPLLTEGAAAALTGKLPAGELVLHMGELAEDERLLTVGYESGGRLTLPTGQVQITLPAGLLDGYALSLLNADGTESGLPYTVEAESAVFTLDFTEQETAMLIRLIPAA